MNNHTTIGIRTAGFIGADGILAGIVRYVLKSKDGDEGVKELQERKVVPFEALFGKECNKVLYAEITGRISEEGFSRRFIVKAESEEQAKEILETAGISFKKERCFHDFDCCGCTIPGACYLIFSAGDTFMFEKTYIVNV